ncbi:MAG: hypothetical protein ACK4YD_05665 [Chitinophagia bacterium]|jgi:hypothetical protein
MIGSSFKAYTELVRDQTSKYIKKLIGEIDGTGKKKYEQFGTEKEFNELVELDKQIQVKYRELENAIQNEPKIHGLSEELQLLLKKADVLSSVVSPSLYKSVVKVGKDQVPNEIARSVFKVLNPETKETEKIELRKTIKKGSEIISTQSDQEIIKEFIQEIRRRIRLD